MKLIGTYNTHGAPRSFSMKITWLNQDDTKGIFSRMVQS